MKKFFMILTLALCFGFASCGVNNNDVEDTLAVDSIEMTVEENTDINAVETICIDELDTNIVE